MIVTVMILPGALKSYGQSSQEVYAKFQQKEAEMPVPQTWSFMKYGNSPVDMYRGIAQVDIPIYTYKDIDFELPISVGYASSGYMPNVQTGILGLGWFLNAGGCITREVRDVPDEMEVTVNEYTFDVSGNNNISPINYSGYLSFHEYQGGSFYPDVSYSTISGNAINRSYGIFPTYYLERNSAQYPIETASDIYHFKFGEHSGSFMLGPQGTIYVFNTSRPNGEYKIDLSNFRGQGIISIQTGDGYIYKFGDSNPNADGLDNNTGSPYLGHPDKCADLSFMLTEITAPNGRLAMFEYDYKTFDTFNPHLINGSISETFSNITSGTSQSLTSRSQGANNVKSARLTQIQIRQGVAIFFSYGEKTKELNPLGNTPEMQNMGRLDKIRIETPDRDAIIRTCDFFYGESSAQGNPITFLTGLQISGQNPYAFTYLDQNGVFPKHGSGAMDHWGYYNNNSVGSDLIPVLSANIANYLDNHLDKNSRDPDFNKAKMGMLEQITYPTGGTTVFEYEPNTYSRKVDRDAASGYELALVSDALYAGNHTYEAGGVRLHKITDSPSSSADPISRTFSYENNIGESSGILLHSPRYKIVVNLRAGMGQYTYVLMKMASTSQTPMPLDNHHIGYSSVRETFSNGSYNDYYFNNYGVSSWGEDAYQGNEMEIQVEQLSPGGYGFSLEINAPVWGNNPVGALFREPISYHNERGKLLSKEAHDNAGALVQKTEYNYYNGNLTKKYSKSLRKMYGFIYIHSALVSDFPLLEKTVTDYLPNGTIITSEKYEYNEAKQNTKITTSRTGSDDYYTTYVTYLKDKNEDLYSDDENNMLEANVVQYPLAIERTYKSGAAGAENVIDAQQIVYGTFSTTIQPHKIQKAYITPASTRNNLTYYDNITFSAYDIYGNLQEQTDKLGVPTSYIWGYGWLYPVARINNAGTDQHGISMPDTAGALSTTQDNLLRALPGTSVTTYEYEPLVGVSQIKDDSGRTISYGYDDYGRLSEIRDPEGNLVNRYEYSSGPLNYVQKTTYTQKNGSANITDVDYYNGLGDHSQHIEIGASPGGAKSIVTPIHYDNMRRESKTYLPYAANDITGSYQNAAIADQATYYDDLYSGNNGFSYAEDVYEASPLNRVVKAYNIGSIFRTADKKSTFSYEANTTNEVKLFKVNGSGQLIQTAYYAANTLNKNTVTNEDGAVRSTFTDLLGRVVLERTLDGTESYDTYYVFDVRGNLCYVLPPELSARSSLSTNDIAGYSYSYVYDGQGRCIEKRLPGAEPILMVYDKGDRLAMTQDGNQRTKSPEQWIYNQYDNLGRLVSQSLVENTGIIDITDIRTHYETYANTLPSSFSTVIVLLENEYGE